LTPTGPGPAIELDPDQQGHLEPLPVAVDIIEPDLAEPPKLRLDVDEAVRRILPVGWVHAAGLQVGEDLRVQRPLPVVFEVMDRVAGDDGVEAARFRKRLGEVVPEHLDRFTGKALASAREHPL